MAARRSMKKARKRAPRKGRKVIQLQPVRARYDAAQLGADHRRHWANADAYDAVVSNASDVRTRLRKHSRYEIANNSYAKGIILTLANDVIGSGPRLQMQTPNPEVNAVIEREFTAWARRAGLASKLRTARMAKATDGEAFILMYSNDDWPVTLDLRLVEADQIENPSFLATDYTEGIAFDDYGRPKSYCLLKSHPGGLAPTSEYENVPAAYMVHWFRTDRPGQIRGVPEITSALPLFAHLRRYTLAAVSAAEIAAEWTMFLRTNTPPGGDASEIGNDDFSEVEIERNLLTTLPAGWDVTQLRAEQPTTTYAMFKEALLNEIARCLNMPYNIAAGNSSGYNYASGRLDHQTYYKALGVEQSECEDVVLDAIFGAWLNEALLAFNLGTDSQAHQWFWDGHEHVDPAKEATAQAQRLASHTTTLAAEYAKLGLDYEAELRQAAKEADLMRELGLTSGGVVPVEEDAEEDADAAAGEE